MKIQPAVPPGLTHIAPDSSRTIIRSSLFTEELLRLTYFRMFSVIWLYAFQLALRSPFLFMVHTAIPPPAALCDDFDLVEAAVLRELERICKGAGDGIRRMAVTVDHDLTAAGAALLP